HAETTELALNAVEESVVIAVGADQGRPAYALLYLLSRHHMNREGKPRRPGPPGQSVFEVITRRGRVVQSRLGSEVVHNARQEVRLGASHEIDIAELSPGFARQWRGPREARGPGTKKIERFDRGGIVDWREVLKLGGRRIAVSCLVEPDH